MGLFGPGTPKAPKPAPLSGAKAAKGARRGGNAIVATTTPARPGRVTRARGGSQ